MKHGNQIPITPSHVANTVSQGILGPLFHRDILFLDQIVTDGEGQNDCSKDIVGSGLEDLNLQQVPSQLVHFIGKQRIMCLPLF